jgi:hypothetical protein
VSRRRYRFGKGKDGFLRILDLGAAPRRWQLIHGSLGGRFMLGLTAIHCYEYPRGDFDTRVIVLGNTEGPAADLVALLDVHTLAIDYPPV